MQNWNWKGRQVICSSTINKDKSRIRTRNVSYREKMIFHGPVYYPRSNLNKGAKKVSRKQCGKQQVTGTPLWNRTGKVDTCRGRGQMLGYGGKWWERSCDESFQSIPRCRVKWWVNMTRYFRWVYMGDVCVYPHHASPWFALLVTWYRWSVLLLYDQPSFPWI